MEPAVTLVHNYIYKEIAVLTAAIIGVLTFLLVSLSLFKVIQLIMYTDLPMWITAKFVVLLMPLTLTITIPAGLLAAVMIVFGRMSSDRELLALKASGIGLAPVVAPVIILSFFLCAVDLWLIATVVPECQKESNGMKHEIVTNNPMNLFTPEVVIDKIPGCRIYFSKRNGAELDDVFIWQLDTQDHLTEALRAERARVDLDLEHQQLVLTLFQVREEQYPSPTDFTKVQPGFSGDQLPLGFSLASFYEKVQRHLAWMTLPEISDVIYSMQSGPTNEAASPYLTEFQARFSFAMAAFTFAVVGIPLAIQTQRRETSFGIVVALCIVLLYFVLNRVGNGFKANAGLYPELIIWAPNILFQSIGAWLFYRANQK
jgi:lipopolysaccharide export system permease protein